MDTEPNSLFLAISNIDLLTIINCLVLLSLLICSALVSGAEVAFFSISSTQLNELSATSKQKSNVVLLLEKPKKLLATILITNNFINILIVLIFASLGEVFFSELSEGVKFLVEVVFVTFLILLFGEVLPKVYATRKSLLFANFMAKPIQFLSIILTPLSTPLIKLTSIVENKLGNKNHNFSVERLSEALELTASGATTKDEQKILEGIVNFGNTETVQIMKPRTDVCAIADNTSYEEVLKMILKNGYSRNPVYHENIDTIIGVLYAKDLLAYLNEKTFEWQNLIRAPFFVPENKKLDDLLAEFKEKKMHLAIVVDEYGGTSGIVTLEDVIEEIVGDINDEFDDDDLTYSKLDEHNYIFEGKITIKDFCRVLDDDDEKFETLKGESETLAGFILEISGKFPKKGEKINFSNYTFTIEALDKKRIKQIKATRNV
ncbi:gliding motility-associated protein GldE [Tenacibaculum finnmarkense]|uniref:Gliding motility-associated protein GldE n=1 Tax=Tenacibaculum finnmarkense genomovar finnmarkense TaxID=1458503 RepID=A0AAP1WF25_9FLAO|nr:gliding motility-associated protein GldE [Tenacibaculum finnmarkense]MBE7651757.1 gliding motility-associated protein GldE [Tenacibaculum finnmarkense genomovar finnmarkense]MBE7659439.1 gliding motility-associated protein GldE [Tenacibaculum finnmarkense genomovar finnmarkense]MBE7692165.1 gliding motility-associated protein GldE [Tenacibaculum finnmarkense genomovar finnmarkense]MBE7693893.1 gliding motility-associated protein GldE [Tenacibaculum finnmarkense genomovar finnmarkense]MCD840